MNAIGGRGGWRKEGKKEKNEKPKTDVLSTAEKRPG
jgi:hypothetical protein